MTPDSLRDLITQTGDDRRLLARLLGYRSDNSLRQWEAGKAIPPHDKLVWLKAYAKFRSRQVAALDVWLAKNPPPAE